MGYALSEICFKGPRHRLDATEISQPAIFVCSAAALAAVREALGERTPEPVMSAGLSLGEYTALYAAGAVDFAEALELVSLRGRYMQEAAEKVPSGMVSILGLEAEKVSELCRRAAGGGVLVPANFNCPGQVVLSGEKSACERAAAMAADFGAAGAVPLRVAGAFHSPLMAPAAEKLARALERVSFRRPRWPVLSNVDARPHTDAPGIRRRLLAQLTNPVRWEESMRVMLENDIEQFYEMGPGRVLAGLMRRIRRGAVVRSVNSADALAKLAGELAGAED